MRIRWCATSIINMRGRVRGRMLCSYAGRVRGRMLCSYAGRVRGRMLCSYAGRVRGRMLCSYAGRVRERMLCLYAGLVRGLMLCSYACAAHTQHTPGPPWRQLEKYVTSEKKWLHSYNPIIIHRTERSEEIMPATWGFPKRNKEMFVFNKIYNEK